MLFIYPFTIAFLLVFVSELGDKTQLIALSFSSKIKTKTILLGVGLGSLLSHGTAIIFGSFLGNIENETFQFVIKLIAHFSFIIFGILTIKSSNDFKKTSSQVFFKKSLYYIIFIALSIAIGELGDKTFLASIGLGIQYSSYKLPLIFGAVSSMIVSDFIAIIFGKLLGKKIPEHTINMFSGILFLIFGGFGLLNLII